MNEGGHTLAGRILMTGGLSVLAGSRGTRAKGSITARFSKRAEPAQTAPDPMEQLRQLASLRDAGVLTETEFALKKAEILARL